MHRLFLTFAVSIAILIAGALVPEPTGIAALNWPSPEGVIADFLRG